MSSVYIESYGCSNSQAEAEIMAGLLEKSGLEIVNNERDADLIIVVTCYVKSPTQQKILFRIRQLNEKYPKKKMIIAGCMPEGIYGKLVNISPDSSLVSTHHVKDVVKAVEKTLKGKRVEYIGESRQVKLCMPKIRKNSLIDIVPISSGCDSSCSYCCVRLAKGRLFSYPKDMIVKEVKDSVKQGCKEIWITSQDNASYGNGKLPELMNDVSKVPGNFHVRIGMMNPRNVLPILPELIEAYRNEKVFKFLHLPVQSGDDTILRKMNREYKAEDFEKILNRFGKNFRYQMWTDVIVGFPGETEKEFQNTFKLIERTKPDWVNISKYGPRPNTAASRMKKVDSKTVNKRSFELSKLVRKLSLEKNKEWVGWRGDVIIFKRKGGNQWFGRNPAYKLVIVESKKNLLGKILRVEITKASHSCLYA
jgi:threonylcarbamoyladenosine tRNA methylthiotransferase CDKAL1